MHKEWSWMEIDTYLVAEDVLSMEDTEMLLKIGKKTHEFSFTGKALGILKKIIRDEEKQKAQE